MLSAFVTGVAGPNLTVAETVFLRAARPCGLILFARNCRTQDQIRKLIGEFQDAIGAEILVLIDQEGGRVQRLRPPLGRALPAAAAFGSAFDLDPGSACESARLVAQLVAHDLRALGINCNCAPVLDVPVPGAHEIISDRAYGQSAGKVATLGRAVADGYLSGGIVPIMKHIPGHGRATKDSHEGLPVVGTGLHDLSETDFVPFKALSDLPAAMTAHVVFSTLDPERPASTSPTVNREIVRKEIGFDGLLMSDDLSMQALRGNMEERASAVIGAGCDVALHCNGDFAEMEATARAVPHLQGSAVTRFEAALQVTRRHEDFELPVAESRLAAMLSGHRRAPESV